MEKWMNKLGLVMNLTKLGVTPDLIEGIADATRTKSGGYKAPTREEVVEIPDEKLVKLYEEKYKVYKKLYPALKSAFAIKTL